MRWLQNIMHTTKVSYVCIFKLSNSHTEGEKQGKLIHEKYEHFNLNDFLNHQVLDLWHVWRLTAVLRCATSPHTPSGPCAGQHGSRPPHRVTHRADSRSTNTEWVRSHTKHFSRVQFWATLSDEEWMERLEQSIWLTEFVHHPQFGPACIHSPHDLAFAFKHLFSSVRKKKN